MNSEVTSRTPTTHPPRTEQARPGGRRASAQSSYGQILKSSALVGGASVLTLFIGMLRTKAMAIMLGPAGFGLMGTFMAIVDLASSVASMGVNRSGVRQIAEAQGSGDSRRIAVTVTVLRRIAVVLGLFGVLGVAALAIPIADLSFGHVQYASAVALLALAVFFKLVADGQSALLQGMRRIADFAKVGVVGAAFGAFAAIPLVYLFREAGVALSIVAAAAMTAATSWWYSRKVRVEPARMSTAEFGHETKALLRLGVAFMFSGLMMMGAAYAVRVIVLRSEGLDAAGLYQAAWTLGGMYVGLILQAMGADFYPRLVAVANNHTVCNRLVNEQIQVSLLLASAGVLATLALAPFLLELFYSESFRTAAEALRWICLGMAMRVMTWPMGFIIIAQGNQKLFIFAEAAWTIINVGLSYVCVLNFGLVGAGIAFFLSYVFHAAIIYPIARRLSGFRLDAVSTRIVAGSAAIAALAFVAPYVLPTVWANATGVAALLLGSLLSTRFLVRSFSPERVPRQLRWLFTLLRLSKPSAIT